MREAVTTLGRPLENVLAKLLADPNAEKGLLTLAQLQTYDVGRIRPESAYAREFAHQQAQE